MKALAILVALVAAVAAEIFLDERFSDGGMFHLSWSHFSDVFNMFHLNRCLGEKVDPFYTQRRSCWEVCSHSWQVLW